MQKNQSLVSVIIPVYKVEQYLDKCVESVVNQTYKNLEIILVDDGSPDNCPAMCDEWAKKDSRIKVIHKKNGGLSDARNAGLDIATGEYISFLDSDDSFSPDFSKACVAINGKNCDVFISQIIDKPSNYLYKYKLDKKNYKIIYPVTACSRFFSSEFLNKNNIKFKVGYYHEDIDFSLKVLLQSPKVINSDIQFYHYTTDNVDSITREPDDKKYYKRILDIVKIIDDISKEFSAEISANKKNYLEYVSSFIFTSLLLIPRIKDEQLFNNAISYANEHKYLFVKPQTLKYKTIKFMWNIIGLKNLMKLTKKIKKI